MAKYLIFDMSSEYGGQQVTVIEWTRALAGRIAVLCDATDQQKESQTDLSEVRYFFHAPTFRHHGAIDDWIDSVGMERKLLEDRFILSEIPDEVLEMSQTVRLDGSELCIVPGKGFYWEIVARHTPAVVQTQVLYIELNPELFDMWITK